MICGDGGFQMTGQARGSPLFVLDNGVYGSSSGCSRAWHAGGGPSRTGRCSAGATELARSMGPWPGYFAAELERLAEASPRGPALLRPRDLPAELET